MRFITKVASLAMALAATSTAASAQAGIPISGSVLGCFFTAPGGSCTPAQSSQTFGGNLTYYGATSFSGTSQSNGTRGFGGNAQASFAGNINNFGSLQLANSMFSQASAFLRLQFTFTQPSSATGTFDADVTGEVIAMGDGSVQFNFPTAVNIPNFGPVTPAGSLIRGVQINDGSVDAGQLRDVSGAVAVVPEPSTYALMGAGLAGLVGMARRRRVVA